MILVGKNGRTVYRGQSERHFLYYHDWGSNQGSNWMISTNYNSSDFLVSSPNVEHLTSLCVDDLHNITAFKPWLVTSEFGLLADSSLRLECVTFEDNSNTLLNTYKNKLRKTEDINRNKIIYNY